MCGRDWSSDVCSSDLNRAWTHRNDSRYLQNCNNISKKCTWKEQNIALLIVLPSIMINVSVSVVCMSLCSLFNLEKLQVSIMKQRIPNSLLVIILCEWTAIPCIRRRRLRFLQERFQLYVLFRSHFDEFRFNSTMDCQYTVKLIHSPSSSPLASILFDHVNTTVVPKPVGLQKTPASQHSKKRASFTLK